MYENSVLFAHFCFLFYIRGCAPSMPVHYVIGIPRPLINPLGSNTRRLCGRAASALSSLFSVGVFLRMGTYTTLFSRVLLGQCFSFCLDKVAPFISQESNN
jgi:hypothetical protein